MNYWTNYNGIGIFYKYISKEGDKILVALAPIAANDIIGAVGMAASSYLGGERNGWKIAGQAAIGAVVGSAGTFFASKAGIKVLDKISKWFFD